MALRFNVQLTLDPSGYVSGAKRAGVAGKQLGTATGKVSADLSRLKQALIGIGLLRFGREAQRLATDFDTAFTRINTLVGVSRDITEAWKSEVRAIGRETGRGPVELSQALYNITSAGMDGAEALDVLAASSKAAAIGLGRTGEVAKAVTAAVQAYGKENLSAASAVDVLVGIVKTGAAEADEVASTLGRVVGIAAQVGVSFQEAGAFIATFTRLGVNAEEAVTALRGVLSGLLGPTNQQQEALALVGMSMADLRDEITTKGLTVALVELVEKFKGNEDALAAIIPNVRALAGVLGTAGSQGESFVQVVKDIEAGIGNVTDEAFELNKADPGFVFEQFKATLQDALLTIGKEMLPALVDLAKQLKTMAEDGTAERIGKTLGKALELVSEHLDDIIFLFKAWLALKVVTTLAGWGTAAVNLAGNIKTLQLALGPVVAGLTLLGMAAQEALNRWSAASERAMAKIVRDSKAFQEATSELRDVVRRAASGETVFVRKESLDKAQALIDGLTQEVDKLQDKMRETDSVSDFKNMKKELEELGNRRVSLMKLKDAAEELPIVFEETIDVLAGTGDAASEMGEGLAKAVDEMKASTAASQALLDALLESQEAYDTLNTLLDAGIPLNEALSGAYDEQAQALRRAAAALEKELSLREEEKELLTSILDLREKVARIKESSIGISGDIEMPEMEPVLPVIDPEALERMNEDWRATIGQMSAEMETLQKRAWENVQDIASDAIAEIIKTGKVDFENLFDSILDVVAQMLAKMLVMWLANLAKRVAVELAGAAKSSAAWSAVGSGSGGGGGGWMGMLKSLFGMGGGGASTGAVTASYDSYAAAASAGAFEGGSAGASSGIGGASWGTLGTMFGIAAAAIIVAEMGNAFIASQKQKLTAGSFGFDPRDVGDGQSGFFAGSGKHDLNEQMVAAMEALRRTLEELENITGASIQLMERIQVNVKGNGRIWVNIGDRLSREVGSLAEAMDLIVTEMLKTAEITGASPAILAALRNSVAESVDELQAEISAALRSEELFLGEEGRTAIREKTNEFFELLQKELELGIIEAQGGSGALVGLVNSYQANFDRLMGITRDAGEVARQQAKAHNAALKMDVARLQVMRAELIATMALAQGGAGLAGVLGGGAQVMARYAEVTAGATKVQAGHAEVMATGAKVTHGMTEVMAAAAQAAGANAEAQGALAQTQAAGAQVALSAAEANALALQAIDEALAALEGLEVDLDAAAAAARRAASGGGGRQSDMESLRDLLDQMRFDRLLAGMTELEAGLARLEREYQANLEKAHGNAELIAQLTEEYRLQEEQLRRQTQLSAVDTFQQFMGIGQDPFAQLGEGFEGAVSAIEDAGFGAMRTRLMVARLTDEYERQLDVLSRQEFVAIGDQLMGFLERYYSDAAGFEEFRMNLERMRFELELLNARQRFEILKAEGTLAQAVLAQMQNVFDFIDENPIDWGAFVAPAAPRVERAAREVNNAFEEMARRLTSAKESIRDFLASLQTGAFGGRSNKQMFEAAQSQFQKIRQGVQAGNIQAIEQFPEVARRFLEIARERFGSTAKFQEILAQVESAGIGALGVSKVKEDNVVFDQRFFQQQAHHVQVDKSGHKSVADAVKQGFALQAAEEERSREDILLELRGLRESQEALNQRLAAIEGSRRVRKAS